MSSRKTSVNDSVFSEARSMKSRASELSVLNDDECKRILSVIERDFKLRQQEFKRIEDIAKLIREENERVEYLASSKDFNLERCIRCFNQFRFLFNPREKCTLCDLYVCHDCATQDKKTKVWNCKSCLKLKEMKMLSGNWFYNQTSAKHKRCGSAKIIRELHKREHELVQLDEFDDDDPGYDTSTLANRNEPASTIVCLEKDKDIKRELEEYSTRLTIFIEKLQADLSERNRYNNRRTIKGKVTTIVRRGGKENLKQHQQQIKNEIARARTAISGPLRRSNLDTKTTHEQDLQSLLVHQTEKILQTNLTQFQQALSLPNSQINSSNFDQKLSQTIFDKCVSREIFQELPDVIDSSNQQIPPKPQRQSSNTSSSLTSLTKPSSTQQISNNTSAHTSSTSWEIKSRNDNIRKVIVHQNSTVDEEENTEKEEREQIKNENHKIQPLTATTTTTADSIEFDNGLKVDLSSVDDESSDPNNRRRSVDYDFEAISRSNSRVGDWQTNFTLIESKSSHSGDETPRSHRESVFLTIPISDSKDLSPRVGDKPLEDLADDDLYADDQSSSYAIPINTTTANEPSQISDFDINPHRKLFPLPANLLLQNHSSCSFRRPSYTYESDNESLTSSISSITDMKTYFDEDRFRVDPNIDDPKFILQPKDTTIRQGETAKFKVKVSGTEPIDVFWFRFGTDDELVNDEKYQLSHDEQFHYLKIYSTNKNDEGAYLCGIANDKAQNFDMVKLNMKDNKRPFTKPSIVEEFSDVDVNEGSPLILKCRVNHGYPKARVLWYKENSLIQPNDHYKLYYYGDGQHALHVDQTTIEDDNGTFTCLALNAAGRAQITVDVFIHEKEVIDIPRTSSIILNSNKPPADVLDLMEIDRAHVVPLEKNEDPERDNARRFMDKFRNERASQLIENGQHSIEQPVHPLKSDNDNEQLKSTTGQPFYLNRRPSVDKPLDENLRSPTFQRSADSTTLKPKWDVRLPQLLNSTVGPDRSKRDLSRRHTTTVVLQQQQQSLPTSVVSQERHSKPLTQSLNSNDMSHQPERESPPSPLVKQLKQKFDRLTDNNQPNRLSLQSQTNSAKPRRVGLDHGDGVYPLLPDDDSSENEYNEVASLTCRGLTSNSNERSVQRSRPMLSIRPLNETNPSKSDSIVANNDDDDDDGDSTSHNHHQKGKTNPPKTYDKYVNLPRTTTSFVKQLINGGGGTLVYDSLSQDHSLHTNPTSPLIQHQFYPNHYFQQQRKENARTQNTNTNQSLTSVTQTLSKSTISSTQNRYHSTDNNDNLHITNQQKSSKSSLNRSTSMSDNLSNPAKSIQNKHQPVSLDSLAALGRKTVLARAELWDRRISTSETDTNQCLDTYDIEQWSYEFEKIQNDK